MSLTPQSESCSPPSSVSSIESRGGLKITRAWSIAGVASSIMVTGRSKSECLLFDCGFLDEFTIRARHVFISHGHVDHIGAIISHARAASMQNGGTTNYYVPESCLLPLMGAKSAFEALDMKDIPMKLHIIKPHEVPIVISEAFSVFAFGTVHRCESQGIFTFSICHISPYAYTSTRICRSAQNPIFSQARVQRASK